MKITLYIFGLLFILNTSIFAHQTGLSYLNLEKLDNNIFKVIYKKPLEDLRAGELTINYPSLCLRGNKNNIKIENGFVITHYTLECQNSLIGKKIWVEGLVKSDKGLLFRYVDNKIKQKDLIRSIHPFIQIGEAASRGEIFFKYLSLGISHILTGYDHLLFVLALLFLSKSFRELFTAVTAFTLAHSVTLGMGIFGLVNISIPFVEAMIAASIIILYREVLTNRNEHNKHLPMVVFFFGLLHGLGFASALSGIGLPRDEIPSALLAFNVGIELGQIIFIVSAFLILKFLYFSLPIQENKIKQIIAWSAGSFSSFWLIERVVAFS
jgi:hydrogenase/urease accessory protein HupE